MLFRKLVHAYHADVSWEALSIVSTWVIIVYYTYLSYCVQEWGPSIPFLLMQVLWFCFSDDKWCSGFLKLTIYYIQNIIILQYGDRDASYDDYLQHLSNVGPEQCRYGLYDFEYEHACQGTSDVSTCLLTRWWPALWSLQPSYIHLRNIFCLSFSSF